MSIRIAAPMSAGFMMVSAASAAMASADVNTVVADVMADASTRSSLSLQSAASGYDDGFVIRDQSDDFELSISGWTQIRYTFAHARNAAGGDDANESGFSLRRTRLTVQGSLYDGAFGFKLTNSFSRTSGAGRLSDAYVTARLSERAEVRFGQFKLPFAREELTSAKRLIATDRSIVNDVFGQGRSQGVELSIEHDNVRIGLAFSDGFDSANTDFDTAPAEWAVTGRIEWLAMGAWRAFREFSSPRGAEYSVLFGLAGNMEETPSTPGAPTTLQTSWTVDGGVEGPGFHVFASASGRFTDGSSGDFFDMGALIQSSVFVTNDIEPFARFDVVIPDSSRPGDDPFRTLTLGANWYVHGQAVKFTLDGQWFFDDVAGNDLIGPNTAQGILAGADAGSFAIRAQFQLVF